MDTPTVPRTRFRLLGYDVHVLELNLSQPWRAIDAALREIAEELGAAVRVDPQGCPVPAAAIVAPNR